MEGHDTATRHAHRVATLTSSNAGVPRSCPPGLTSSAAPITACHQCARSLANGAPRVDTECAAPSTSVVCISGGWPLPYRVAL